MANMLGPIISLLLMVSTTIASSQSLVMDSVQPSKLYSAATNTSNIIILGGGASGTTGSSGWTGSTVSLSQCNARCASVNLVLFTTCGSYANVFRDQMRCSCSTTFISEVEICSSCCDRLSYQSQFQELTQVSTACQVLAVNGNTTDGAMSISYSTQTQYKTVTNFATISYETTATVVVANPTTHTTTSTNPTPTTTSTSSSNVYTTTSYATTTTSAPSTSTTTIPVTNPLPTVALPTVTAISAAMDSSTSVESIIGSLLLTSFFLMATALF